MTEKQKIMANRLLRCSFLPGSFDKRFVKQLPNWENRDMTEAGAALLEKLFTKYRRQIPDYSALQQKFNGQTTL